MATGFSRARIRIPPPSFAATDFQIAGGSFLRTYGGTGTTADPYLVFDAYGLQGMGSLTLLAKAFAQYGNIDLYGVASWNGGKGWAPIGSAANPFTGSFTGKYIYDLTINRPTEDNVGLFGVVGPGATIDNVGLYSADPISVTGNSNVGALAGTSYGTITNSFVTNFGLIHGSGSNAGGLIGDMAGGSLSNSFSAINVQGDSGVGGLGRLQCRHHLAGLCHRQGHRQQQCR